MATAEFGPKPTDADVTRFLDSIADEKKRAEAYEILDMMRKATKAEPKMWGSSIVGFGDFHYVYDTGREGDVALLGFSPRRQNLTLYAMGSGWDTFPSIKDLGKYTLGKGCLYIKRLDDVNKPALKKLLSEAVKGGNTLKKEMAKKKK